MRVRGLRDVRLSRRSCMRAALASRSRLVRQTVRFVRFRGEILRGDLSGIRRSANGKAFAHRERRKLPDMCATLPHSDDPLLDLAMRRAAGDDIPAPSRKEACRSISFLTAFRDALGYRLELSKQAGEDNEKHTASGILGFPHGLASFPRVAVMYAALLAGWDEKKLDAEVPALISGISRRAPVEVGSPSTRGSSTGVLASDSCSPICA